MEPAGAIDPGCRYNCFYRLSIVSPGLVGDLVISSNQDKAAINRLSSPEEKVALFRSLFRGRDDVYPRRFESARTGKSGYAPACDNEWVTGLCEKPRIKCADCANRRFLPVTDEVVRRHLSGHDENGRDFVAGVYPMLLDETCFLLAVDFDKQHWRQDAAAYLETCAQLGLPGALERSRSGNGGHVWLFFEEAISAGLARRLGSYILTETMERRPDIGLDSYDRFFPRQDTLPRGGFGNLIALPLQKEPRQRGNSVFLDERLDPYTDQWQFLAMLEKLDTQTVEDVVRVAQRKGRVVGVRIAAAAEDDETPWETPPSRRRKAPVIDGPLPDGLELVLVLANEIYISKDELHPALQYRLLCLAAFQNPEFYKAQAMRLPTYDKPRIVACAENHTRYISLPRGCFEDVIALLGELGIKPVIRDERFVGVPLKLEFHGQLTDEQLVAADALLEHDTGVLSATTAFGKTVVGAWLVAQRGVNTLVLVHRRQLLEQWVSRLSEFLGIDAKTVGRIGGGRKRPTGSLDVAIIQSVIRKGVVDDRVGSYGQIIVDECHHLSARSFEEVVRRAKSKYVTGLTATPTRKDGLHPIIFMQCGPIRHRVDPKQQAAARPFDHSVHVCPTSFRATGLDDTDPRGQFHQIYEQLIADDERNRNIRDQIVDAVNLGRSPIVLTERKEHLDRLADLLKPKIAHIVVLRGGMGKRALDATMQRLMSIREGDRWVLLATGRYIGEGFDDSRLDTLFLTLPVSWRGTIAQYVGRLHRLHDRKREVRVYDYADLNVPMLARMFDRRCKGYEAVGYKILLPASAVPGWPAEVPLPVDPLWKENFAATVRRLARDGADAALANLFLHVARTVHPESEGENRARSASEAFLYRRLETLPETAGRFCLNAELPIPFDGTGKMEVDLLCSDARLVIELDGGQHLDNADAYRRDRRKDALLQERGYMVLRFLTEDVGKDFDLVLDATMRAISARMNAMEARNG